MTKTIARGRQIYKTSLEYMYQPYCDPLKCINWNIPTIYKCFIKQDGGIRFIPFPAIPFNCHCSLICISTLVALYIANNIDPDQTAPLFASMLTRFWNVFEDTCMQQM